MDCDGRALRSAAGVSGLLTARIANFEALSAKKPRVCVLLPISFEEEEEEEGNRESAASFEMCSRHRRTLASKSALRSLSPPLPFSTSLPPRAARVVVAGGGVMYCMLLLLLLLLEWLGFVLAVWSECAGSGLCCDWCELELRPYCLLRRSMLLNESLPR